MIKFSRKTQPVYVLVDLFFILISFFVPYIFRYNFFDGVSIRMHLYNFTEHSFIFTLWTIFIVIAFNNKHLYSTNRNLTIPKELQQVIMRIFYTSIVVGAIVFFMKYKFFSRLVFIENIVLLCTFLGGWRIIKRLILRKLIREGFHNINVLVVGMTEVCRMLLGEVKKRPHLGFNIIGLLDEHETGDVDGIPVLGKLSDFAVVAKNYFVEEVIVTVPFTQKPILELVTQAQKMRLGVRVIPEQLEEPLPILSIGYLGVIPVLTYWTQKRPISEMHSKRILDLGASLILVILLFIPCVIIGILIKIDSSGPVFYVQKRVGLKGRTFNFYKFRSMFKDADKLKDDLLKQNESKDNVMFKIKKDPRVTKIGKFLRKYSLDELPQFFNVLKGNMSLVGPRPPLSDEVQKYSHDDIERLSIKPGITGLSQIKGRSDLSFSRWVKWDLWYINNWSFGLDIRILSWTIPAVLKGKGAY